MSAPLVVEGNLPVAMMSADGQAALRDTRRALVTGGRGLLTLVERKPFRVVGDEVGEGITVLSIALLPEVERRIRVSGGTLSEEEIILGLDQIRASDEDVVAVRNHELMTAYADGCTYTMEMMQRAVLHGDERALSLAWETARKTMGLRKRIDTAAGPGGEGRSAPGRPLGTDTTGEEQRR